MEFRRASDTEQALALLAQRGDYSARLIAGGTDVMMQYARGEVTPAMFVHIEEVRALANVAVRAGAASRFGTLVTHRKLATDPVIQRLHPALSAAAATVGGWQTQAVGTLGGNICNASPAADTAVPLSDFFQGRRAIDRRPDELVTAIEAQPIGPNAAEVYIKAGRRGAMVVAVVGLAVRLLFDADGRHVTQARVALCSVAPTPIRAHATERVLAEGGARGDSVAQAGQALLAEVAPIDDARGTAAYRQMILPGLLKRAVACCWSRASAGEERPT